MNNFPKITHTRDIEYFDGPILMEHIAGDTLYLSKYGGLSKLGREQYLMIKSSTDDVKRYENREISMRTLLKVDSANETAWVVEYSKRGEFKEVSEMKMNQVPKEYFPTGEAFFDENLKPNSQD